MKNMMLLAQIINIHVNKHNEDIYEKCTYNKMCNSRGNKYSMKISIQVDCL
jgi:hypothetical protein